MMTQYHKILVEHTMNSLDIFDHIWPCFDPAQGSIFSKEGINVVSFCTKRTGQSIQITPGYRFNEN